MNNSRFHGILAVNTKEFTENKEDLLNIGEEGVTVYAYQNNQGWLLNMRPSGFTLVAFCRV